MLELTLPKFSMSSVHDMRDLLANMNPEIEAKLLGSQAEFSQLGLPQPFSTDQVSFRSADLRTCTANVPVALALPPQVINKVLFEMSEGGAGVQGSAQGTSSPLKVSFNRPFFFCVSEANSNAILLLGKITNPTL